MFPFDADCADCRQVDPNSGVKGKYYCEKHKDYVSANKRICKDAAEVMGRPTCDKNAMRRYSKEHGYYVVTAITEILELDSDNQYMESFKYLRDIVLPEMPYYQDFIEEYENIGPDLADRLRKDANGRDFAEYLRAYFLDRFVSQFVANNVDNAVATYSLMLGQIKERYGLSQEEEEQKGLVCKGV